MNNYAVLVNTTDTFEDCWMPFFTLFSQYWPDFSGNLYLNTESKVFSYPGLKIVSVQNGERVWSDCVRKALDIIEEEYVLYLQEDYFFKDYVRTNLLEKYFGYMQKYDIDCIHLTDQYSEGPFKKTNIDGLMEVDQKAPYRISCQAAIWKKEVLRSYLRKGESGWYFEEFGTLRSHYTKHRFYSVDRSIVQLNKFEIIPYIFTGIVGGKWLPETENLFLSHNIQLDFSERGFIRSNMKPSIKKRLISKLKHELYYWKTIGEMFYSNVLIRGKR
jgi:hypothetical protein